MPTCRGSELQAFAARGTGGSEKGQCLLSGGTECTEFAAPPPPEGSLCFKFLLSAFRQQIKAGKECCISKDFGGDFEPPGRKMVHLGHYYLL